MNLLESHNQAFFAGGGGIAGAPLDFHHYCQQLFFFQIARCVSWSVPKSMSVGTTVSQAFSCVFGGVLFLRQNWDPPWNYHSTWKMVGRLLSFWEDLVSGATLVSGSVEIAIFALNTFLLEDLRGSIQKLKARAKEQTWNSYPPRNWRAKNSVNEKMEATTMQVLLHNLAFQRPRGSRRRFGDVRF